MGAKLKVFARAIAALAAHEPGLHAIYLPEFVDGLAEDVVRAANTIQSVDGGGQPFAVVVDETRPIDESGTACRRVSMGALIKYRTGNRLAVVAGPHSVPASIAGAFVKVPVGSDYPGSTEDRAGRLGDLADRALEVLLTPYAHVEDFIDMELAAARLRAVLVVLASTYEGLAQGVAPWNVYWFRHVDSGLQNLSEVLKLEAAEGGKDIDHILASRTHAAFGLPTPAKGVDYGRGRSLSDALTGHWGSTDAVLVSLDHLLMHPSRPEEEHGQPHPLAGLDFDRYDSRIAAADNVLLAWGTADDADLATRMTALGALTEAQFFTPDQNLNSALSVLSSRNESLTADEQDDGGPHFIVFEWDMGTLKSEELRIHIPTEHISDDAEIATSSLLVTPNGKGYWTGDLRVEDGQLIAVGTLTIECTSHKRMAKKPVILSVRVPPGDLLAGLVGKPSSPPLYPMVNGGVGVWSFDATKQGTYKSGIYRGYQDVQECIDDAGTAVPVDAPLGSAIRVVTWGPSEAKTPVDTRQIRTDQTRVRVDVTDHDLVTTGDNEFVVGNLSVRWSGDQGADEYLSPLVAAAQGGALSAGEPDHRLVQSLRGRIESFLTGALGDDHILAAHGHMAIFADSMDVPDRLEPAADGAVLTPQGGGAKLASGTNFSVSPSLRTSPEAERFRDALRKLRLAEYMTITGRKDDGVSIVWPSRTSWEELHGSSELDEYLVAYTALVERASSGTSRDQFWAAFPFSLVVYGKGSAEALAVLLTPFHPLRLAWLAAAEASLRRGTNADLLAGILEGWNLPMVGPQPNSTNGRVIAVPIDAGAGQLFLGWSMMVSVSVAGPQAIDPPSRIGALAAPGSSVTGLNADAVKSALTTFQRMNPHVATLSLDLAASAPGARMEEIDDAIVDSIARSDYSSLRGGVRVHDSMNRLGDAPLEELERRLSTGPKRPVRWARYREQGGGAPRSNLRFLEDAGMKIEVSSTAIPGTGLLADVPIRRFLVPVGTKATNSVALSYPGVQIQEGSSAFHRALGAMERVPQGIQLSVELFKAALVNESSDWTVTGESLLGASSLADLLSTDGVGQMLWEWRPPYLSRRNTARLDARPFVSVVRVPRAFRNQIARGVAKAAGDPNLTATDRRVEDVMSTLGARGIGLSTLMALGGTHAAGAIGFYLALRLIEATKVDGYQLLVLPIDACDEFLRALAGGETSTNQLRRADLLLLAVRPNEVVLIPVEIKSYGLESNQPPSNLPSSESQLVNPLGQLESTAALVQQLVQGFRQLQGAPPEDAALWRHGLATMVEAAIRLHPGPDAESQDLLQVLAGILDGRAVLRSGGSLVTFFGHGATGPDGAAALVLSNLAPPTDPRAPLAGALLANTQAAFKCASSGTGELTQLWSELVRWAVAEGQTADEYTDATDERELPEDSPAHDAPTAQTAFQKTSDTDSTAEQTATPDTPAEQTATPHPSPPGQNVTATARSRAGQGESEGITGDGVRFSIGKTIDGLSSAEVDYWPSNTALTQMNVGVIGDLGTGKTQFLKALVRQLRRGAARAQPTPLSMLIFDYKRDYQDDSFLHDVGGSLLRPFHIPLDVLAINGDYTPQKAVQSASAFIDVLAKIYSGIGPIQRNNLLLIIKQLFEESGGKAPTLGQIVNEYETKNGVDSVVAVLNGFVLNEVFSEDRETLLPMEELLADRVLVLAVSDLGADEKMKTALITLFLNKYYEYMLRLQKWPYEGEAPRQLRRLNSFVLVDEATNIMQHEFPVLSQLLLQGREFGVGVILASQYISHFKVGHTKYGETLLTKVIHKVPETTIGDLRTFGISNASQTMANRVPNLQVHQALCKTWGVEGRFMRGTPYFDL